MKITLEYESSWRNSFLEGSNNEALPKGGRKFIGSMTNLKNQKNFIERQVNLDTVMGVLNRLIGDQSKLYQARNRPNYYFRDLEALVKFYDSPRHINEELVYIRNTTGNTDRNSYAGMVKVNDPAFTSDYSTKLWSVLSLTIPDLCRFIVEGGESGEPIELNPLAIVARLEELNKLKPINSSGMISQAHGVLSQRFEKFKGLNAKGEVLPISLYCSALYLQLDRLKDNYKTDSVRTNAGGLSGISKNVFTKKNFMSRYATGGEKRIWGNPYMRDEFIKGEGKSKKMLKKVSGTLEIELPVEREQARAILQMIENAGVSCFYLGKKGLAYVSSIRI